MDKENLEQLEQPEEQNGQGYARQQRAGERAYLQGGTAQHHQRAHKAI